MATQARSFGSTHNVQVGSHEDPDLTHSFLPRNEVLSRVLGVMGTFDKLSEMDIKDDAVFTKDLGLDSLDTVEVVMAFEDEFTIEINDADAEKIHSCEEAIKYILQHPYAK